MATNIMTAMMAIGITGNLQKAFQYLVTLLPDPAFFILKIIKN
jgi:hypothetical protein